MDKFKLSRKSPYGAEFARSTEEIINRCATNPRHYKRFLHQMNRRMFEAGSEEMPNWAREIVYANFLGIIATVSNDRLRNRLKDCLMRLRRFYFNRTV